MLYPFIIHSSQKEEMINITSFVEENVKNVQSGIAFVYIAHTTAAIVINENADPNIGKDFHHLLQKLVPSGIWEHDKIDQNAAAHLKAMLIGPSSTVVIEDGRLKLGTWQDLFLVEFDGPREREIFVKVLSS